jgi:hypothetical protein
MTPPNYADYQMQQRLDFVESRRKGAGHRGLEVIKGALEKLQVVQQDKYDLQAKFKEDKEKIQKENDQLLAK